MLIQATILFWQGGQGRAQVQQGREAAESWIRDLDVAEEMVQYSAAQILIQAGHSMLAQANQNNNGILTLLR